VVNQVLPGTLNKFLSIIILSGPVAVEITALNADNELDTQNGIDFFPEWPKSSKKEKSSRKL